MLFRNDLFPLNGRRLRVLHIATTVNTAWVIDIDDAKAWPFEIPYSSIRDITPLMPVGTSSTWVNPNAVSDAARNSQMRAQYILGDLPLKVPDIFQRTKRGALIQAACAERGCSHVAVHKNLRRFWVGGQTPEALFPKFDNCGRSEVGPTRGRGMRAASTARAVYQLKDVDLEYFKHAIETEYLKDARCTIAGAFNSVLRRHYQYVDGNGKAWLRPEGERPTLRQFAYRLRQDYGLEVRLRRRKGDKDFDREDRAVLGSVGIDCIGVGHYYEADATISDVYLVSRTDRSQIIGKPTVYLVMDRKSRLIVGFYVGLENPSWLCAMQAFISISQDKRQLCERYDVPYDPADWPANMVFPIEILGDRGELFTKTSSQLASNLTVTVTNVPSRRGDWKPIVETGFKQQRVTLEDSTPGFDPPENAKRRMGRHYEKDACLTLPEFTSVLLHAIIKHNRQPMRNYELSLSELQQGVVPTPVALWNHGIVERSGLLHRYSEDTVRKALLPRSRAIVTKEGIRFNDLHYTCAEAVQGQWFTVARKKSFTVEVAFDLRLADSIYVFDPFKKGVVYTCVLTKPNEQYVGLGFAEVAHLSKLRKGLEAPVLHAREQARADYHHAVQPIFAEAKNELRTMGLKKSRSARKADTKPAREADRRIERQELLAPPASQPRENMVEVVALRPLPPAVESISSAPVGELQLISEDTHQIQANSIMDKIRAAQERMQHG